MVALAHGGGESAARPHERAQRLRVVEALERGPSAGDLRVVVVFGRGESF